MQKIHFIIHFFITTLHFKEFCNLIRWQNFGPLLRTQNSARYVGEISIAILVFILDYFQLKLTWQNFSKSQKNSILGLFWALFAQIWAKMNFPGKKGSASFSIFKLSTIVPKIRKTLWTIPEKTVGRTHQKAVYSINFFVRYSQYYSPAIDLKILQSDWPRAFWAKSQEAEFSQIWDCSSIQQW